MRITLKNLHEATAQQVFDQVANHLLTQGRESMVNGRCLYRAPGGLQCAAGCLVGDDEYDEMMEKKNWSRLVSGGSVPPDHEDLIFALQKLHDTVNPFFWETKLIETARDHGLSEKVITDFRSEKLKDC